MRNAVPADARPFSHTEPLALPERGRALQLPARKRDAALFLLDEGHPVWLPVCLSLEIRRRPADDTAPLDFFFNKLFGRHSPFGCACIGYAGALPLRRASDWHLAKRLATYFSNCARVISGDHQIVRRDTFIHWTARGVHYIHLSTRLHGGPFLWQRSQRSNKRFYTFITSLLSRPIDSLSHWIPRRPLCAVRV